MPRPAARPTTGRPKPTTSKLTSNGHAGPSRLPAVSKPSSSKKRAAVVEESDEEDDLLGDVDELDLSEGDDEAEEDDADEEEDEDEEDFPELDSGSEDEGVEATTRQLAGDESSEEELLDDEESGSESGYNSSDIDALDSASSVSSSTSIPTQHSGSSKKSLSVDEKLSRLIAKNSVKPDERIGSDLQISNAKSGKGALRPSKLVEGGYKREYEDVEAGYGSESSTEDVSGIPRFLIMLTYPEPQYCWKHPHGVVRRPPAYRIRRVRSEDLQTSSGR